MRRLAVAVAVALVGCTRAAGSGSVDAGDRPPATALREQARLVLEAHCGECHIKGYSTAKPGALRVFDLTELDWSARMSDAQLKNALWRLGEPLDPHAKPSKIPAEDRAIFKRYVDEELAGRQRKAKPR